MVRLALLFVAALGVAGCQSTVSRTAAGEPSTVALQRTQAVEPRSAGRSRDGAPKRSTRRHRAGTCVRSASGSGLAGRTITVSGPADIKLRRKEVVLTFDDGPMPGNTTRILNTLGRNGVRATFFAVGRMATAHPKLLRRIAREGHTIGHHTYRHPNLRNLRHARALAEISRGERAVAKVLSGAGLSHASFFRFPYLADTRVLRSAMRSRGTVVIDVDIDSQDYFKTSGSRVLSRTMARLRKRGKGVILFHDIHARTASMLPGFLATLRKEGYKVVHIKPSGASLCPGVTS